MIRVLLLVVLLILAYWGLQWLKSAPPQQVRKIIAWSIGLVFLLLLVSGHLNTLLALLGVGLAFLWRMLPVVLRYAPHLQQLWETFNASGKKNGQRRSPRDNGLSTEQALEILGLKPGASKQDIVEAHRRLIAKLHPDKGGSDYLAAQINLAKRVLLQR